MPATLDKMIKYRAVGVVRVIIDTMSTDCPEEIPNMLATADQVHRPLPLTRHTYPRTHMHCYCFFAPIAFLLVHP